MPLRSTCWALLLCVLSTPVKAQTSAAPAAADSLIERVQAALDSGRVEVAVQHLQDGVQKGYARAMLGLGLMHVNGVGVPEDEAEAVRLFRMSADLNDVEGIVAYAAMLRSGRGIARDTAHALRLLHRAAELGHPDLAHDLGHRYERGQGVPVDSAKAASLFALSAENGHRDAQHHAGVRYLLGNHLEQQWTKGLMLLQQSARQGYTPANQVLSRLQAAKREESACAMKRLADAGWSIYHRDDLAHGAYLMSNDLGHEPAFIRVLTGGTGSDARGDMLVVRGLAERDSGVGSLIAPRQYGDASGLRVEASGFQGLRWTKLGTTEIDRPVIMSTARASAGGAQFANDLVRACRTDIRAAVEPR